MNEKNAGILDEERGESYSPPVSYSVAITPGDVDIFKLISEYRFLHREHISALTGRDSKRIHRRLYKLLDAGHLSRIVLPQQKHIYALGKAALQVLVEEGSADLELLDKRLRYHELKPFFLNHEMMIVDFHVILSLATPGSVLRLVSWREGSGLYDSVKVADQNGLVKLPIRPDAFFTIEDSRRPVGANRFHFFLEADRATTRDHARFMQKIRGYWHYLERGLHERKFGIKNFRVLVVTKTSERAENLANATNEILREGARKHFLFTWSENFSLDDPAPLLDNVYISARTAGTNHRHPLVPPPPLQSKPVE